MSDLFSYNLSNVAKDPSHKSGKPHFGRIFLVILFAAATPFSLLVGFNYFTQIDSGLGHAAQRMTYLTEHPDRAQTVLFGSSRANALDLQSEFPTQAYTYITRGGYTLNFLADLEEMVNKGVVPQQVLLALGEATLTTPRKKLTRQAMQTSVNENDLQFWEHLVYMPTKADFIRFWKEFIRKAKGPDINSKDLLKTGRMYCYTCEMEAQARTLDEQTATLDVYIQALRETRAQYGNRSEAESASAEAQAISTMRKIIELTDAHDIDLFIFIDPIYQEKYLEMNVFEWLRFKRKLSRLSPFLDFSNFNETFADPMSFNDIVHYNRALGKQMVSDIQIAMAGEAENLKLGTWVTAETVDDVLATQEQRYVQLQQHTLPVADEPQ